MIALSKNKLKFCTDLHQKKFRDEHGLFIAEGVKVIQDLIKFGNTPDFISITKSLFEKENWMANVGCELFEMDVISAKKISLLNTPPEVFAVFKKPVYNISDSIFNQKNVFVFENLSDPGNLGTIIRTAHWFGIKEIILTYDSVETWNPKVIQSSMGSATEVKVYYLRNEEILEYVQKHKLDIYITDMQGEKISEAKSSSNKLIVLGSESHGVSDFWKHKSAQKITIPFQHDSHPESLNVAMATGILMYELGK